MNHSYPWLRSIARVISFLAACTLLGFYINELTLILLIGVFGLLGWHYWRLYRLNHWLWHSKKISPPTARGIWSHIYQGIYGANLKSRNKRKALGEIIRRFRQGSEALPDAAIIVDGCGDITWCNRLARIELGLSWPDDMGKKVYECINDKQFVSFYHANSFAQPIEIISPINPNKVLELRVVPYEDEQLMVLFRDVTRLTQIEKMRKDFVANVSHELKTPLTVINGYLEMLPLNGDVPEPMMVKAISEMRTQSLRMQSLIEELLVLSRIEASTERAFEKLVNVPQLLWQIQIEAEALNRDRKHKLFFDISPILYVYGNENELRSAFSNLIFNGIHYTPNGGVIEVKWGLEGKQVKFSVKDNGEGIASEHIKRLTERFYRVDKARSRTTGGSGLGLSIVKHVLSHHNSVLNIESKLGKGSTFSCCFSPEQTYIVEKPIGTL
ncbi:phosphate regulon sensor histidine kinase PhoR [Paraglaciecola arctica]|uniref:Phosphate regulon sensor protein PhoR n=1 Tax=Paraglaciecola arctica BSs20135 TaxID=493475 RepID=K6YC36_9ALTE|nr:phosphate regulon sensor histidine kinase PhoR [Paraglaciecola arctica]GAC21516.1 two-component system, OmpR family, phosphate regulon sensor histidine kinase PhoR [Paraglaciecola arctica BSs20135]